MIKDVEKQIENLNLEIEKYDNLKDIEKRNILINEIKNQKRKILKDISEKLEPFDRVYLSRHINRPKPKDFIYNLLDNIIEFKGDRFYGDDKSIIGGIATFKGVPVTFIGNNKGRNTEENIDRNFGMANPEGYRKAIRLMKQADKFNRPIFTFIDTPGAFPGIGAEERGQGEAIAQSIVTMSSLTVPVISIITGEGASGGALALGVGNKIIMMENAIYSILSPEGFASILWKDSSKGKKATKYMKLTSMDLLELKIIDYVIKEDIGFTNEEFTNNYNRLSIKIKEILTDLFKYSGYELQKQRVKKFREFGV